jgi:hypothetical protein
MASFGVIQILMLVLSGGGSNELLDFLPTDAYWQTKGVTVTVQAMAGELSTETPAELPQLIRDLGADDYDTREAATQALQAIGAPAKDALQQAADSDDPEVRVRARKLLQGLHRGGAQARAVRRLMAIRTLGELGKAEALPVLRPLVESKELFVAQYARRAMAAIEGRDYTPPTVERAALEADLRLLPNGCGLVGQTLLTAGSFSIEQALEKAGGNLPGGMDIAQIKAKLTQGLLMVAEKIGNVRVDALTLGLSEDVGDNSGFVVVAARGLYDADAVKAVLRQIGAEASTVNGVDVLKVDSEFRLIPCSNERFVLVGGPRRQAMQVAMEPVTQAIQRPPAKRRFGPEMEKVLAGVDTTQPLWVAARVTDAYRVVPLFAAFESATLGAKTDAEGALVGALVAKGTDPAAVKTAADTVKAGIQEGIQEMQQQAARMPFVKPLVALLKSLDVSVEGGTLTINGKLEGFEGAFFVPTFMFWGMARAAPHPPPAHAVPEAPPPVPAPR